MTMTRKEAARVGAFASQKTRKEQYRVIRETYNKLPKLCTFCGNLIPYEKRWNKFCNASCAATYNNEKYPKRGISKEQKSYKCQTCGIETLHYKRKFCSRECYFGYKDTRPFDDLGLKEKRDRVFEEQKQSCIMCNNELWNGKQITLEMDHIDGNRKNNERKNLRGLCPNCHAQTDTYKGRNVRNRFTDDEIIEALHKNSSAYGAMMSLGMSPQRNVYRRVRNIVSTNNIILSYTV